jgi:hypothetical protein
LFIEGRADEPMNEMSRRRNDEIDEEISNLT